MSSLVESLNQSKRNREAMLAKYGFVPMSVLGEVSRGALDSKMFSLQKETARRSNMSPGKREKDKRLYEAAGIVRHASRAGNGRAAGGLSMMPAELVKFFIDYYADPGDVYLDLFMGHGIRMQVAKYCGLHYYGYDASEEFCAYIDSVRQKIDDETTTLSTTCGDSRAPDNVPDGVGDFGFTSPPYWDIEYYGESPAQIGTNHSYADFLAGLRDIAAAWLPKFKPGAWHIINVGDFRKDGVFYPYHADTITAFVDGGWTLTDVWVIRGLVGGMMRAFAVSKNLQRQVPRIHEYALVFQKADANG